MNREEVINSIALKKYFCKDFGLSIAIYDNPYFYDRLCTLDVMFGCCDKFEDFCCDLEKFCNEREYFEYCNAVKYKTVSYIKSHQSYIAFNEESFGLKALYPKRSLYNDSNNGRTFISVYMEKLGYSALNYYSSEIFGNSGSWEEFMMKFTDNKYVANSERIMEAILGECQPEKQAQYGRILMSDLLQHIIGEIKSLNVFSLSDNEIILHTEECGISLHRLKEVIDSSPIGSVVKISMFDLERIKGTTGWMKTIYDFESAPAAEDIVEFKHLDADVYHQVVKYYYNEAITDDDLVFCYNGRLANFLKAINNPWE